MLWQIQYLVKYYYNQDDGYIHHPKFSHFSFFKVPPTGKDSFSFLLTLSSHNQSLFPVHRPLLILFHLSTLSVFQFWLSPVFHMKEEKYYCFLKAVLYIKIYIYIYGNLYINLYINDNLKSFVWKHVHTRLRFKFNLLESSQYSYDTHKLSIKIQSSQYEAYFYLSFLVTKSS